MHDVTVCLNSFPHLESFAAIRPMPSASFLLNLHGRYGHPFHYRYDARLLLDSFSPQFEIQPSTLSTSLSG